VSLLKVSDKSSRSSPSTSQINLPPQTQADRPLPQPSETVQPLKKTGTTKRKPKAEVLAERITHALPDNPTKKSTEINEPAKIDRPRVPVGYFTVGSTKDDVLDIQGTPSSFSEYSWHFGLSRVDFQNGKVTSWYNSPLDPLEVKMLPNASASASAGYFTVGSTKDEVLLTQGTPTSFGEYSWHFGLSRVDFQNGKVTSWYNSPLDPLKVNLQK